MYYKVLKNGTLVDVLDHVLYIKHQVKHNLLLLCDIKEAQAILSSNGKYGWHIPGLYHFQPDNQECQMIEISKYEYDKLKLQLS